MNSAVELTFKVDFAKFRTCGSHEQCTRSTNNNNNNIH